VTRRLKLAATGVGSGDAAVDAEVLGGDPGGGIGGEDEGDWRAGPTFATVPKFDGCGRDGRYYTRAQEFRNPPRADGSSEGGIWKEVEDLGVQRIPSSKEKLPNLPNLPKCTHGGVGFGGILSGL
jgi:hypothetical protein